MLNLLSKLSALYAVMVVVFVVSMLAATILPSEPIKTNITRSVNTLQEEGIYASFGIPQRQIVLDNFMDALLLNTVYSVDSSRPLRSALGNIRLAVDGSEIDQIKNLQSAVNGTAPAEIFYERYWHGYFVYLRPLLLVFSYSGIRVLMFAVLYVTAFFLLDHLYKTFGVKAVIPLLLAFLFTDFFFIWKSLQFSGAFLIALLFSLILLKSQLRFQNLLYMFFIAGAMTTFVDMLTAPLVTLGLMLYVQMVQQPTSRIFSLISTWGAGYASLWASKWLLVEWLIMKGSIASAWLQIVNRTINQADANFSHLQAVLLNIRQLIGYHPTNKVFLAVFIIILALIFFKYHCFSWKKLVSRWRWAVILVIPYIWYSIAANHSYLHVWYTYRAQLMSVSAGFWIYLELLDINRIEQDLKKLVNEWSNTSSKNAMRYTTNKS